MNKVQKIREEVVRMHNLLPVVDGDNIYLNYADRICTTLEMYIDSLQEELKFKVGDRIRLKGTTVKGDVIKNIYKTEDGNVYFEFENSDDALADDRWQLVEEPKVPIVETADGGLWNGNMKEEPVSKDYRERYKRIAQSEEFKKTHEDMSVGEIMHVEGEEPVSDIDFEQELYKAFGQVKDFTLGLQIAKRFYDMGKNHQEPVSEDFKIALNKKLREAQDWTYIEEEGGECPLNEEFGAFELKEFAEWGAKWQREQMMAKAIDTEASFTMSVPSICISLPLGVNVGDKVKVIVIKED